jgi:two-component system response regulator FixJ
MRGPSNLARPTIFVVDDDAAVRDALKLLLRSVGHAVETFGSAQEFLDAYGEDRAGCLVLDIRMPGMSGLELQQKLNE